MVIMAIYISIKIRFDRILLHSDTKVGNKKNITGSLDCRSVKTFHQEFIQQIQKIQH